MKIVYNFACYQIVKNGRNIYNEYFKTYNEAFKFLEYKIHGTIPESKTNKNQSNIRL